MLKIAVVEDQTEVRESLCQFIRQYAGEQGLQAEVEPFADGAVIAEGYRPGYDIIFLDVEMPRLGGFGAAERIRAVDPDVVLVFVTNMAQYAIKGYEVDALDYVLKPVSYGAFCTKLSRAIQRVQRRKGGQVALQLSGGGMQLLDTGDILYLETRNRMLYYHTATQEYAVRGSLAGAEKQLAAYHFARCNQCFHTIRSHNYHFSRSQFLHCGISHIQICKALKGSTVGILFLTNDNRCSSVFIAGTINSLRSQDQHRHRAFYDLLCIPDTFYKIFLLINDCSNQLRGIDLTI